MALPGFVSAQPEQLYLELLLMLAEGASGSQAQNYHINQSLLPGADLHLAKHTFSYIAGGRENW